MKIVHLNKIAGPSGEDVFAKAVSLERAGELDQASKAWSKIIKTHPLDARAYDRLMIIYRKMKEYEKELQIINAAISVFENNYRKRQPAYNKKITALSKALLKATGLADKKGNNIYQPGELTRWKKRKSLLMKRSLKS